jgi:hypothetical protein
MKITNEDNVITGTAGRVEQRLIEGSAIKMGENVRIAFSGIQSEERSSFLKYIRSRGCYLPYQTCIPF